MELMANLNSFMHPGLPEVRCKKCKRLLFYGKIQYVEIKCPKCNLLQNFSGNIKDNYCESKQIQK